jgi:hypothetical protein
MGKVGDRFASTFVIENCEPNFRFESTSAIRRSSANDRSSLIPEVLSFAFAGRLRFQSGLWQAVS